MLCCALIGILFAQPLLLIDSVGARLLAPIARVVPIAVATALALEVSVLAAGAWTLTSGHHAEPWGRFRICAVHG